MIRIVCTVFALVMGPSSCAAAQNGPQSGSLRDGESTTFPVSLAGGVEYAICGSCADGCEDLDLRLEGPVPLRVFVAEDLGEDNTPAILFTPEVDSTFKVHVRMAKCSGRSCEWEVTTEDSTGEPSCEGESVE